MNANNIVNIHGKDYMTVAGRVQEAGKDFLGLETEVITHDPVVIKATVLTVKGKFTGISAANPSKTIEKMSPYEVAETSAVGRALGFAGYGSVDSIASADEMVKSTPATTEAKRAEALEDVEWLNNEEDHVPMKQDICPIHKVQMEEKKGQYGAFFSHYDPANGYCSGNGWKGKKTSTL